MSGEAGQRMQRLGEVSLRVWRLVAARGAAGITSAQIHSHFEGSIDSVPLTSALKSLRISGYLRSDGKNKWSTWAVTDKVPKGEARPAWADEAADSADDKPTVSGDDVLAAAKANGVRVWPFGGLGRGTAQAVAEAAAAESSAGPAPSAPAHPAATPQQPATPWFSLDSDGCLSLRADGVEGRLSSASTRTLFRWLDQLAMAGELREMVEVPA